MRSCTQTACDHCPLTRAAHTGTPCSRPMQATFPAALQRSNGSWSLPRPCLSWSSCRREWQRCMTCGVLGMPPCSQTHSPALLLSEDCSQQSVPSNCCLSGFQWPVDSLAGCCCNLHLLLPLLLPDAACCCWHPQSHHPRSSRSGPWPLRVLRSSQLDAQRLDAELQTMLQEQFMAVFQLLPQVCRYCTSHAWFLCWEQLLSAAGNSCPQLQEQPCRGQGVQLPTDQWAVSVDNMQGLRHPNAALRVCVPCLVFRAKCPAWSLS